MLDDRTYKWIAKYSAAITAYVLLVLSVSLVVLIQGRMDAFWWWTFAPGLSFGCFGAYCFSIWRHGKKPKPDVEDLPLWSTKEMQALTNEMMVAHPDQVVMTFAMKHCDDGEFAELNHREFIDAMVMKMAATSDPEATADAIAEKVTKH